MNRTVILGAAVFLAVICLALFGGNQPAFAGCGHGYGCGGCAGHGCAPAPVSTGCGYSGHCCGLFHHWYHCGHGCGPAAAPVEAAPAGPGGEVPAPPPAGAAPADGAAPAAQSAVPAAAKEARFSSNRVVFRNVTFRR